MANREFPIGVSRETNPMTKNIYYEDMEHGVVAPGSAEIIVTEDEKYLTTESDQLLITEGT